VGVAAGRAAGVPRSPEHIVQPHCTEEPIVIGLQRRTCPALQRRWRSAAPAGLGLRRDTRERHIPRIRRSEDLEHCVAAGRKPRAIHAVRNLVLDSAQRKAHGRLSAERATCERTSAVDSEGPGGEVGALDDVGLARNQRSAETTEIVPGDRNDSAGHSECEIEGHRHVARPQYGLIGERLRRLPRCRRVRARHPRPGSGCRHSCIRNGLRCTAQPPG